MRGLTGAVPRLICSVAVQCKLGLPCPSEVRGGRSQNTTKHTDIVSDVALRGSANWACDAPGDLEVEGLFTQVYIHISFEMWRCGAVLTGPAKRQRTWRWEVSSHKKDASGEDASGVAASGKEDTKKKKHDDNDADDENDDDGDDDG